MSDDPVQPDLFDKGEWWDEHWKGMPEFVQKDLLPLKTVYVHFESAEDMQAFATLIGQKIAMSTKYVWYPESEARAAGVGRFASKRYVDSLPEELSDDVEVIDEQ